MGSMILTDNNIVVHHEGAVFTVSRSHESFAKVLEAAKEKKYDQIAKILNPTPAVAAYISPHGEVEGFEIKHGVVFIDGRPFSEAVSRKALRMIEQGVDPGPIRLFLKRLRLNPSYTSQQELLLFMVANEFMISDTGAIVALAAA